MKDKLIEQQVGEFLDKGYTYRQIKKELNVSLGFISFVLNPDKKQKNREQGKLNYIPHPRPKIIYSLEDKKLMALKRMLKHRYSITYDDYLIIYENQNRCCAICKNELHLGTVNGLYVDHEHSTGKIRGLLCPNCNTALGKFKDSRTILQNAINYLTA